ncbi:glutamine-hydrolyzing carbamoyl-phosphate synthase small subunit [Maritalea sp.]|jgi:carbamoyl-phosphate synthase small subunit|uniref:glutamine-hydrolyzing carbamoyl-phosphate synthase small subunit n=1 Tax=Maritalea sp. TaxID=2003361 RepID=UPI0039E24662
MTGWQEEKTTALLILENGTRIEGRGLGATGHAVGEVCFNTAMTGYQEILTDLSYAGQIITFTFPHIGNVGVNDQDVETPEHASDTGAKGCVLKADVTNPSNYRSTGHLDAWLKKKNIIGIAGVDTRALTSYIREKGLTNGVIAHAPDGVFDEAALAQALAGFKGLEHADLAADVSTAKTYEWKQGRWVWNQGFASVDNPKNHIVAIDYGAKANILRCLAHESVTVTVVSASTPAKDILALNPDGIFLSNGPGDPAATGKYAVGIIKDLIASEKPIFGICLGHQLLALALGGKTVKMHQGHHGANHPVKDLTTGKVEITSMNHGFAVDADSLPLGIAQTHISLFDQSNCGLSVDGKPIFSVQYHPEASPGPHDSHYLFKRFMNNVSSVKTVA